MCDGERFRRERIRCALRRDGHRDVVRARRGTVTRAVSVGARQNGAGSILGVAIIGTVIVAVMVTMPLYSALTLRQAVAGAADAAALAAADVAVGIEPGVPCEVAAAVAAANGARLASCELDGLIATVSTARSFLGLTMSATARAGPPR